ncbi:MAG: Amylo-alpha-1,6-glucosidase [Methanosaeta sp. PtaB.Bin039]|nr:MAG: Amylo-alpha-1,6-glucosidase [Methanosaeta sp. PtaB.Bin039]
MTISLKPDGYLDGVSREWVVGNGIGGYASSTSIGANTRSYHGLLVAAREPPSERWLLLSSLDETVNGIELANHQYPGAVHPQGFAYLQEFTLGTFPAFRYRVGDVTLDKQVAILGGENTAVVRYRASGDAQIKIVPLVTSRSFHKAEGRPALTQTLRAGGTMVEGDCPFFLLSDRASYHPGDDWYYGFQYQEERSRGLLWTEDLQAPGHFQISVDRGAEFCIMASTWRTALPDTEVLDAEQARRSALETGHPLPRLAQAADSFIVRRDGGRTILAGYHWFDDWGRDAMIALPGLLLVPGRYDLAREVLLTFARASRGGLLPNDLGAGSYYTVDASLWFVRAVHQYYLHTKDASLVREIWPALQGIIEAYQSQTPVSYMDQDGLIVSAPGATWMDARVDGQCVTPRSGKACEINALWYAALLSAQALARTCRRRWRSDLAEEVRRSFGRFWNDEAGCLYDVIDPVDPAVRPNQVIAAAFTDLLSRTRQRRMMSSVEAQLLTPYGLRTLSPHDRGYIGRYQGDARQRDLAYHQGTVWPWLLGPYVTALINCGGPKKSVSLARAALSALLQQDRGGLCSVAEIYDGDAPHRPGGCISQAWSVGELIRADSQLSVR